MPWYWCVDLSVNQEDVDEVSIEARTVHAEYEESGFLHHDVQSRELTKFQVYKWNGSVQEKAAVDGMRKSTG
jgi:hypothetical protein